MWLKIFIGSKNNIIIISKVIHRDLKPENVLVGKDDEDNLLYVCDFGISKFYKDDSDNHM